PELVTEVLASFHVSANQALNRIPPEQPRLPYRILAQGVQKKRAQWASEPFVRGYVEALLLADQHGPRQAILHQPPQEIFLCTAANLQVRRKRSSEFDDAMIEEWRAHLQ